MRAAKLPTFQDPRLFQQALIHRSYVNEVPEALESNERLEFLGDAVLNFISGSFLYREKADYSEAKLTKLRSRLVDEPHLAELARSLDLSSQMKLGRGELQNGGQHKDSLLSDTFEAVVGAYYLDSGIDAVREFVEPLLEGAIAKIEARGELSDRITDAKSRLQEWVQARHSVPPQYATVNEFGPPHQKTFVVEVSIQGQVYGRGQGSRKRDAEQAAARQALQVLHAENAD